MGLVWGLGMAPAVVGLSTIRLRVFYFNTAYILFNNIVAVYILLNDTVACLLFSACVGDAVSFPQRKITRRRHSRFCQSRVLCCDYVCVSCVSVYVCVSVCLCVHLSPRARGEGSCCV